jgi:peptide chain release factor 1
MLDKLDAIEARFREVELLLSSADTMQDMKRFAQLNKEYSELKEMVEVTNAYKEALNFLQQAKDLMANEKDAEMREMAREEADEMQAKVIELEERIKILLIPKDPEDAKNAIIEIRAGTGGDEASLFAGDLMKMYYRYCENRGWKVEILDENEGTAGGYKEVIMEITGSNVYGDLKYESGVHRVQRVPKTESAGRVHTSAATVAIIPVWEDEEININRADLKIDTFRASGAGGQHVNKTESAIRITHLPTGIVSESQDGRSQHQNKEIAMQKLYQRILDQQTAAKQSELAAQRKSLVGSGDRSEKIRTYNYPQNRCTDHRINLTLYNLDQIMDGQIDGIIEALQVAENARILEGSENG